MGPDYSPIFSIEVGPDCAPITTKGILNVPLSQPFPSPLARTVCQESRMCWSASGSVITWNLKYSPIATKPPNTKLSSRAAGRGVEAW